jgi:hypothetical protein
MLFAFQIAEVAKRYTAAQVDGKPARSSFRR